jgi:hypothetical protein
MTSVEREESVEPASLETAMRQGFCTQSEFRDSRRKGYGCRSRFILNAVEEWLQKSTKRRKEQSFDPRDAIEFIHPR